MNRSILPYRRQELRSNFDRLFHSAFEDFENMFLRPFDEKSFCNYSGNYPRVNLTEHKDHVKIEATVPGMKEDEVSAEWSKGMLVIKGESQNSKESNGGKVLIRELHKSSFTRTFPVPEDKYSVDDISANVNNGILSIIIPKRKVEKKEEVKKIRLTFDEK